MHARVRDLVRPRLLLFGWYQPGTGFTRVLEALLPTFAKQFEVIWMGVGYRGPETQLTPHVRLLPTNLEGGDLVGAYQARERWLEFSPDAIFALNDPWYLSHYSRALGALLDGVPMIGYLPLDGRIPDPSLVAELTDFSQLITYTQCAANDLRTALRASGITTPVARAGHGVDLSQFRPLFQSNRVAHPEERMAMAQALFGLPEPSFVVLNASRPDPRKRIDISIAGFAQFARQVADPVYLCLHQAHAHPDYVLPLRSQAEQLGIAERILWHPQTPGPISDEALNQLYNACALGINTAVGEGFGLVSFEHAATGVPQILPQNPALTELWGVDAWQLPTKTVSTDHSPLLMSEPNADDLALALTDLYEDRDVYQRMANAALERTRRPDLRWLQVANQISDLLCQQLSSSTVVA